MDSISPFEDLSFELLFDVPDDYYCVAEDPDTIAQCVEVSTNTSTSKASRAVLQPLPDDDPSFFENIDSESDDYHEASTEQTLMLK